jgi:hypothetical protein
MHDNQTNLPTVACSQCNAPAMLRIVMPSDKPGYDQRQYECIICKHSETLLVATEPR